MSVLRASGSMLLSRRGKILACAVVVAYANFGACHHPKDPSSAASDARRDYPWLAASPNPVPAGLPEEALGTTVITWNSGGVSTAQVCVKVNRSPEVRLTEGGSGSIEVPWIGFDSLYEFRLYSGGRPSRLLSKVEVVRDE
ncbi:MAG: hypothetical protein H0W28_09375 [Pyrinomonadaceae bacterium]|nr:hypothetical protein [Pyrinomonadaceae bacterium]